MKVLLANKYFFGKGGSERVFFQEREFLLSSGVEVVDFSMEHTRNVHSQFSEYFVSNINYHGSHVGWNKLSQGAKLIHSREAVKQIELLVQNEKPDIAHLHNIYHQLTPSIISVLKKYGVKVVLTLHDGKLICPGYLMLNGKKICTACRGRHFWKPITTRCQHSIMGGMLIMLEAYWHKMKGSYDGVDIFISPSRFIADLVSQRIEKNWIRILHNGINANDFNTNCRDEGYVLYVGRLSQEKGILTLLDAHGSLYGNLTLKVVGTGPIEDDLSRKSWKADFLGYKGGDELNDIMARSSFVVVPSECYENCSMVILEAMAMGKPIIASRIGGIPEQVEDGKTGFLFEMGNVHELAEKIKLLAENAEVRVDLGKAARKKLEEEYSLENHCRGLLQIYEGLVAE